MNCTKNRHLLCLGYYFPPTRSPEAIVSAKRTAALKNWDVDFVTLEPTRILGGYDPGLLEYVEQHFCAVERLKIPLWIRALPTWLLVKLSLSPDWMSILSNKVFRHLIKMKPNQYDAFMSCSQSHSSHLVGLKVKKANPDIPWIAHFSDPWVDNPYVKLDECQEDKERELEKEVFENADLLIFTSQETLEHVARSYSTPIHEKMRVLPHAFDADIIDELKLNNDLGQQDDSDVITIRHIGALYGERSPVLFFEAVKKLIETEPTLMNQVRFELIGPIDEAFKDVLSNKNIDEDRVRICAPVTYFQSLQLIQQSDILMVIDAPAKENIFLPSKLVDYIGAKKPIIALSPMGSTYNVVKKYGGFCASPEDVDDIAETLKHIITRAVNCKDFSNDINHTIRDSFKVEKIGETLASYIDDIVVRKDL